MCQENQTKVMEIYLLGLQGLDTFRPIFFVFILLIYIAIITGNILIILLVATSENLKIPMFIFLQHLALADALLATCVIPMMANIILWVKVKISLVGCFIQMYFYFNVGLVQCFLLAVMSYDRYVAICNPLQYIVIMDGRICFLLVYGSWAVTWVLSSIEFVLIVVIQFCGLNEIDYLFCDVGPVIELATSDTSIVQWLDFIYSVLFFTCAFTFIIGTYIYISVIILKISSSASRHRAFSTCSAHLTSVGAYYGTLITIYVIPSSDMSSNLNKYTSLLYTVVTPLLNPIIYSLRTQEIRQALHRKLIIFLSRKVIQRLMTR